jgi:hypothetical protein
MKLPLDLRTLLALALVCIATLAHAEEEKKDARKKSLRPLW